MVAPVVIVSSSGCACTSSIRRSAMVANASRASGRVPQAAGRLLAELHGGVRRRRGRAAGDRLGRADGALLDAFDDLGAYLGEVAGDEVPLRLLLEQRHLAAAARPVVLAELFAVLLAAGVEDASRRRVDRAGQVAD